MTLAPALIIVMLGVLGARHHLEIFERVVLPIPVAMMNDFVPLRPASEVCRHDENVLKSDWVAIHLHGAEIEGREQMRGRCLSAQADVSVHVEATARVLVVVPTRVTHLAAWREIPIADAGANDARADPPFRVAVGTCDDDFELSTAAAVRLRHEPGAVVVDAINLGVRPGEGRADLAAVETKPREPAGSNRIRHASGLRFSLCRAPRACCRNHLKLLSAALHGAFSAPINRRMVRAGEACFHAL